jgi:kynurenine formamidase
MRRDALTAVFVAAVLAATFAHLAAQPPAGQGQGQGRGQGGGAGTAQAPAEPVLSPGPAAARFPRDAAEFDQMFQKVKNWGRWGPDDQLGAANLITEAKRRQAAELVKQGVSVSLAHNPLTDQAVDNPQPFEHTMNRGWTTDTYRVSYHGYAHSHIDALCHILYQKQTYNGYSTADINTEKGCTKLGIDRLKNGIVTRGILIDIPRLRNVNYLEPGTPVFVEDLEAWEKKARIKVSPGDAIFLRTGRWARRAALGPWAVARNAAGYHASIAPWLKERGVSFIGSDVAQDVVPSLVEGIGLPIHTLAITALGIDILDNQDLEAVGDLAAKLNRWEFMVTIAPVPVTGGTGFPVNALAIF